MGFAKTLGWNLEIWLGRILQVELFFWVNSERMFHDVSSLFCTWIHSLELTASLPENGWLEDDPASFCIFLRLPKVPRKIDLPLIYLGYPGIHKSLADRPEIFFQQPPGKSTQGCAMQGLFLLRHPQARSRCWGCWEFGGFFVEGIFSYEMPEMVKSPGKMVVALGWYPE